jgi:hypothetical protein
VVAKNGRVDAVVAVAPSIISSGAISGVKYTTSGTYAGGTTLRVDAISNGLTQ